MTIRPTVWRKRGSLLLVFAAALAIASVQVAAQAPYPNKPIRIIVPYPPGAGTDFTGREIGAIFSKALGQAVVIDNRGGAAATIGHALGARAAPMAIRCCSAPPAGSCPAPRSWALKFRTIR